MQKFDYIVVGSGLAGLYAAYKASFKGSVAVITKSFVRESNSFNAQGGIAAVTSFEDDPQIHKSDTLIAGRGLCEDSVVDVLVNEGPDRIKEVIADGMQFDTVNGALALGLEGGHHKRRILHAGDITGAELERVMVAAVSAMPNIRIFEYHIAVDLVMSTRPDGDTPGRCSGAYVLDIKSGRVLTMLAPATVIACGGIGKVYLYTSNPDVACGSGVAMAYRAGANISNMEFVQFHPTILHHAEIRSFLISEALRGEGAVLKCRENKNSEPVEFMHKYHPMKSLAPRDVVARAIDSEMKRTGEECVFLDIRHLSEERLKLRFPHIFAKCLEAGVNMAYDLIPVVPAAHFSCGGITTDINGATSIIGLYAAGESACTGLHGANRLASNSLLEALVVSRFLAKDIDEKFESLRSANLEECAAMHWSNGNATDSDEQVVISHNWEEIRRFMWDYVGIYRTNKRLERAEHRIRLIQKEIDKYYRDFIVTADLIELRNIATVAELIIKCSLLRHESRGLHYNADYPDSDPALACVDTVISKKIGR